MWRKGVNVRGFSNGDGDSKNIEVQKLLSILKEYGEEPKGRYSLKFTAGYFFTPSPVSDLPYDLTFDIGEVHVIKQNGKKSHDMILLGEESLTNMSILSSKMEIRKTST